MSTFTYSQHQALLPFPTSFPVICCACNLQIKEASFKRDIIRHARLCKGRPLSAPAISEVLFECTYCKSIHSDRRKATTHQGSHCGDPNYHLEIYPCANCNRAFGTQKALSSHARQCGVGKSKQLPKATNAISQDGGGRVKVYSPANAVVTHEGSKTVSSEPTAGESEHTVSYLTNLADLELEVQPVAIPVILSPPVAYGVSLPYEEITQSPLPLLFQDPVPPIYSSTESSFDQYQLPFDSGMADNIDAWLNALIPPKQKKPSKFNGSIPLVCSDSNTMSPADLQKLYSSKMRRALDVIQNLPEVNCGCEPTTLHEQLSNQFALVHLENTVEDLWPPCTKELDSLASPFRECEFHEAINHENSAPGPDGWTYKELNSLKDFVSNFLKGVHAMAGSGRTPLAWKHYNSLLLFKKLNDYAPGMEKHLKNFRPIALSNVSYKLLTSVIAKRLSKWLDVNKGISFGQRAVFSRRGVKENTLIVSESLRTGKPVMFLDITDAFNSVSHDLIFESLKQCKCPNWIVEIIRSLYLDCSTTPVNLHGQKLCDKVDVQKGVRQGCPLSSLLFNLIIDPLVKVGSSTQSTSLGYMDDIAIIFESEERIADVTAQVSEMAGRLGLRFNPSKCGIANASYGVELNGEAVPIVTEERAYKYLGTSAFPNLVGGIELCFERAWAVAEAIENSKLTPMQKLHALRSKVIPMLYHLLENSSVYQKQLQRFNRALRKMCKRILFLPERATNSYIHLHRMYGGPGLPDLVLLKARLTTQSFLSSMNLSDELGVYTRKLLSRGLTAPELIQAINNQSKAGLSHLAKETASSLKRLSTYLHSDIQLRLFDEDKFGLLINNIPYRFPWPTVNRMLQRQSLKMMTGAPNQGRFWQTLSANPLSSKGIYSFHTKMSDWRFIHKARLNLTPLKSTFLWNSTISQTCRRCQSSRETLNHVLNSCACNRKSVISRHNEIRDQVESSLPKRLTLMKEQRFGNMQPDLIVQCPEENRSFIIDVKVSSENPELFDFNEDEMTSKYDTLRRAFEIQGSRATIHVVQLGALGSVSRATSSFLSNLIRNKRKVRLLTRKMSSAVIHYARNFVVSHLTGTEQNF